MFNSTSPFPLPRTFQRPLPARHASDLRVRGPAQTISVPRRELLDQLDIRNAGHAQSTGIPGLACPQKFTRTAQLQILLCQQESVIGFRHRLQTLVLGFILVSWDQQAVGLVRAATDPAAQLVELCQAETVRTLDDASRWRWEHPRLLPQPFPRRNQDVIIPDRGTR